MVTKDETGLMSAGEVAEKFSVTSQQVLRAIRANRLKARKVGWSWVIDVKDLPKRWSDLNRS